MMRRFKASKYKNAAPKLKKHEPWVRDLVVGSYNCSGSFIKASAAFVAFNVQATGSQLGVVSLDAEGVAGSTLPILNTHSDLVTDFEFSPFEDGLLATGSADSTVKIWSFNNNNINDLSLLNPELVMSSKHRRVETVCFSPTAEYLLSFSAHNTIQFWDILYGKELLYDTDLHGDTIMSMSWSKAGSLLATCAKDKQVRIVDPRANVVTASAVGHENGKDSRVVWLGDSSFILTSGFDSSRMRQLFVWDTRSFEKPIKSLSFGSSTGILMPLHDPDTNMIFLAARGDSSIGYYEFAESDDFLTEGYRYNGDQTKGACLLPKRALKVMDTEVNRILQLTANSVVPIPFHVPRKSYIDFHHDLYPDTCSTNTTGSASVWMDGFTGTVSKMSLNPSANGGNLRVFKETLSVRKAKEEQRISKVIELPESEKYKKAVPEPRPRKKSISSGSSSSDEVAEAPPTGKFFPVPKPRVSSSTASSVLRTPSSFISSRMTADFTMRNSVPKDVDSGLYTVPTVEVETCNTETRNGSSDEFSLTNDNESEVLNNNNDQDQQSLTESNDNDQGSLKDPVSLNGNEVDHNTEDNKSALQLSTSDRRKLFENRAMTTPETCNLPATDGNGESFENRKPRMSVAERMKMFQQNSANSTGGSVPGEEDNNSSQANNSHPLTTNTHPKITSMSSEDSSSGVDEHGDLSGKEREPCPAPIAKPERKFTPPKQEPAPIVRKPESTSQPTSLTKPPTSNKRIDTVFGQVSKYRNYKAAALHKKMHLENLRNISTTCPGESELIQANPDRVAVPLNTPGGKVAIFELGTPGRQPDGVIPALVHGSKVMDFMWDPFDNSRLAVGDDSGKLWLWTIPDGGLKEQTNESDFTMAAHAEKIYFVRFHPLAQDVLATGSYDMMIRIWDLDARDEIVLIRCFDQIQMFCFAWSPCGQYFSTAAKDGKLRVYDPRADTEPIAIGQGPPGVRGGRVCWVLDGKYLIVAGFDRSSERQLHMYNASDLSKVATVSLDVSPAILVPFYDEDSSVLFLSGRGDSTIFAYDVIEGPPYLLPLSPHRCSGAHQGIAFLKKNACEVQNVEFAKAYRLTEVVIEPWSFTVPRVKSEYFQDDLFPPTRVLWEPTMTSAAWANGSNVCAKKISLKPSYMRSLGEVTGHRSEPPSSENGVKATNGKVSTPAPLPAAVIAASGAIGSALISNGAKKQQEKLEQQIKNILPLNLKLEQDDMEGVDEEEWDE
ncbi:unnamed protein product [Orchesella dallaii]|uniref:Coronin n=1 Tax=Orchesella dallaii TaxID=48710 RepID=A0ABP1Q3K4_9HEXA